MEANQTDFVSNTATRHGGGLSLDQSAFVAFAPRGFLNNSARGGGGAVFTDELHDFVSQLATSNTVRNNSAHFGPVLATIPERLHVSVAANSTVVTHSATISLLLWITDKLGQVITSPEPWWTVTPKPSSRLVFDAGTVSFNPTDGIASYVDIIVRSDHVGSHELFFEATLDINLDENIDNNIRLNSLKVEVAIDPCPRGTFFSGAAGICMFCTPGRFSNVSHGSDCALCPAGRYSRGSGAACVDCPVGEFTPTLGSPSCSPCQQDSYSIRNGSSSCNACPFGARCRGDGYVRSLADFWLLENEAGVVTPLHCPPGFCLPDNQCAPNREHPSTNPLCGRCKPQHSGFGDCTFCDQVNMVKVIPIFIFSLVLVPIALFAFTKLEETDDGGKSPFFLLRPYFYYIQTILLMLGPVAKWLAWINLTKFMPQETGGVCLWPLTSLQLFTWRLIGPFLTGVWVVLVGVVVIKCQRRRQWLTTQTLMGSLVLLLEFSLYTLFASAIQVVGCVTVANQRLVFFAPDVECAGSKYEVGNTKGSRHM